jgi:hypothetical protein
MVNSVLNDGSGSRSLIGVRAGALIRSDFGTSGKKASRFPAYLLVKEQNLRAASRGKTGISLHWKTPGGKCIFPPQTADYDRTSLDGLLRELHQEGFLPDACSFTPSGVYFVDGESGPHELALHFYRGDLLENPLVVSEVKRRAEADPDGDRVVDIKYVGRDDAIRHNSFGNYKDIHSETLDAILDSFRWAKSEKIPLTQSSIDRKVDMGDIVVGKKYRDVLLAKKGVKEYEQFIGRDAFTRVQVYYSVPVDLNYRDPKARIFLKCEMFMYQHDVSCMSVRPDVKPLVLKTHVLDSVIKYLKRNFEDILKYGLVEPYMRNGACQGICQK